MKLKYSGIIEIEPCASPGFYSITRGTELVPAGRVMSLRNIQDEGFTAADCDALNLLDPDRTERLCPPIIG